MKLILGNGKTAQSIMCFLDKQNVAFIVIKDTRDIKDMSILKNIDEIFVSPGIPQTQAIVCLAKAQNIPVSSDITLFSRYAKAPIIGITGSNGKSTVTQLLGEMIANDGKNVAVGGNIGIPALECLNDKVQYYVLELSSYQLDYTKQLNLFAGVVLNITPEHLESYPSFKHYINSKLSLYAFCQHCIINLDEPLIPPQNNAKYFSISLPKTQIDFGVVTCHNNIYLLKGDTVLMNIDDMPLIGQHNIANALSALTLGEQIGLSMDSMLTTIKTFKGLKHRLELITKKHNITYYNDSKATNSIATISAINALSKKYKTIVLILGGMPKKEDYNELFTLINEKITNVILIGQSTDKFAKKITCHKVYVNTMQSAVTVASSTNCEVALLSPACSSFDMFSNFEQRGELFNECVLSLH